MQIFLGTVEQRMTFLEDKFIVCKYYA